MKRGATMTLSKLSVYARKGTVVLDTGQWARWYALNVRETNITSTPARARARNVKGIHRLCRTEASTSTVGALVGNIYLQGTSPCASHVTTRHHKRCTWISYAHASRATCRRRMDPAHRGAARTSSASGARATQRHVLWPPTAYSPVWLILHPRVYALRTSLKTSATA